ncbi:MAG: hypothetical protein WDN72_01765 [Alphaproteobacteria bacterium]
MLACVNVAPSGKLNVEPDLTTIIKHQCARAPQKGAPVDAIAYGFLRAIDEADEVGDEAQTNYFQAAEEARKKALAKALKHNRKV